MSSSMNQIILCSRSLIKYLTIRAGQAVDPERREKPVNKL